MKNKAKLYSSKTQKSRTLFWVSYRVESTSRDGCTTSYTFDTNGQMIEKTETREQEETTRNYIYLGSKIIAHVEAEETYYYGTDHLGSTVLMTNEAGEVTWTGEVTPFADSESVSNDSEHVMYTGKELDPDTGLYYFNARWYDPQIGRFTTEDPIRDGLNWYAYCSNNPLRFIDPSGLEDAPIPSSDEIAEAYNEIYGEGNSEWSSIGDKDDENNSNGNGGSGKSDSNNNKPDTTTGTGSTDKKDKKSDSDGDNDDVIVEEGGNNKYSSTEEAFKGKKDADKWIAELEEGKDIDFSNLIIHQEPVYFNGDIIGYGNEALDRKKALEEHYGNIYGSTADVLGNLSVCCVIAAGVASVVAPPAVPVFLGTSAILDFSAAGLYAKQGEYASMTLSIVSGFSGIKPSPITYNSAASRYINKSTGRFITSGKAYKNTAKQAATPIGTYITNQIMPWVELGED